MKLLNKYDRQSKLGTHSTQRWQNGLPAPVQKAHVHLAGRSASIVECSQIPLTARPEVSDGSPISPLANSAFANAKNAALIPLKIAFTDAAMAVERQEHHRHGLAGTIDTPD